MNTTVGGHPEHPSAERPLRLWPGVLIAALIVLVRYVIPFLLPDLAIHRRACLGVVGCGS